MSRPPPEFFPPPETADADGLIGLGGELSPAWLLDAYRHGIFPWPVDEQMLAWWSPDPRAILELDALHVARRLRRTLRSGRFQLSCNRDFAGVVEGCATSQDRRHGTWITAPMQRAYRRLHEMGIAHSVEAWHDNELAGGVYGVAIGGFFAGESMFYRASDASKVALVGLVEHLRFRGYRLFDIQQLTSHTARLGATEIPRRQYLSRLADALAQPVRFGDRLEGTGLDSLLRWQ